MFGKIPGIQQITAVTAQRFCADEISLEVQLFIVQTHTPDADTVLNKT